MYICASVSVYAYVLCICILCICMCPQDPALNLSVCFYLYFLCRSLVVVKKVEQPCFVVSSMAMVDMGIECQEV